MRVVLHSGKCGICATFGKQFSTSNKETVDIVQAVSTLTWMFE